MSKPIRVVHISWLKRSDGELGGVEKFAWYLDRALDGDGFECDVISWNDYPSAGKCQSVSNPDKALLLGSWVEKEMRFDIAVSDGYWGAGITAHPVVPVVHGTWAEFSLRMGGSPSTNPEVRAQHDAFNAPNSFPVACSPASERELLTHHRRQAAATILHGIDLEVFCPRKFGNNGTRPIVLQAAGTNAKKGAGIMEQLGNRLAPAFDLQFLAAGAGEEPEAFQRGEMFIHPSRHEGNAYALLEALAVALPIVTTPVGLFETIPDEQVGRVLPVGSTIAQWCAGVRDVWGDGVAPYRKYAQAARELAYDVADYWKFRQQWRSFLGRVAKGEA